jgi:LPXTG-motif cell wall-anchored protein
MISLVTPLLAVVIGWLTIGERLPPLTFLGGALIVASVALIVFRRRKNEPQRRGEAEKADLIPS